MRTNTGMSNDSLWIKRWVSFTTYMLPWFSFKICHIFINCCKWCSVIKLRIRTLSDTSLMLNFPVLPIFYLFSRHNASRPSRDVVVLSPKCVASVTWSDFFPQLMCRVCHMMQSFSRHNVPLPSHHSLVSRPNMPLPGSSRRFPSSCAAFITCSSVFPTITCCFCQ